MHPLSASIESIFHETRLCDSQPRQIVITESVIDLDLLSSRPLLGILLGLQGSLKSIVSILPLLDNLLL